MAGNHISTGRRRSKKRAALLALSLCLVSTGTVSAGDDISHKLGDSVTTIDDIGRGSSAYGDDLPQSLPVRMIESHTSGVSIGCHLTDDEKEYWRSNVTVDVSGSGGGSLHRNVTGIYLLDGAQLTIGGDLMLRLVNRAPATCGATPGADVAHYYMSGVYAGYGGQIRGRTHGDTRFTLGGTLDMDVVGVGLQANKDGYITVGGGRIVTHELDTDTYALLAEEGSVFMNTGADGRERGTRSVNIHGNLGVLHKNYGIDPNPDRHGSFISLALPTADSVLTGAILNEYEESGRNPHNSGVDLYLSHNARWYNCWLGAPREKAALERLNADTYLYRGSKLRTLCGGAAEEEQGIILQQEMRPILVDSCSGFTRVVYAHAADGSISGGDFIVRHAAPGSCITLRMAAGTGVTATDETMYEALRALAGNLRYQGYAAGERSLRARVEIAADAASPALLRGEICFNPDGQGAFPVAGHADTA